MRILLIIFLLLITSTSWGAISFDSASSSNTTASNVLTFAATAPSCSGAVLVVCSMQENSGTISSVTYNGVSATIAGSEQSYQFGSGHTSIYTLLSPTTGSNNVVVTYTDVATDRVAAIAGFYCGVDAIGNANGANAQTVNVTTAENNSWVVSCFADISPDDFTIGGDLTDERHEFDGVNHSMSMGDGPKVTAGSFTATWTEGSATDNAITVVEIQEAASGSSRRRVITTQ